MTGAGFRSRAIQSRPGRRHCPIDVAGACRLPLGDRYDGHCAQPANRCDGEFSWRFDVPKGAVSEYAHSPIGFHDGGQVAGTPFFDDDRFVIKFNNFWTIEAPPGYAILFTHPVNRADLPFTTLTGLVDCDTFHDSPISFLAHWHDAEFNGVLPKGTPVAQCLPVKRESWIGQCDVFCAEEAAWMIKTRQAIGQESYVYRRRFRMPKR